MVVVCVQAMKARGSPTRPHRINPANYARFQSTGRLCWPQSRSGFFVEEILIFLSEIEPQWPGSCFRWSGNQIEWGLLTVIKTVLYTWWLSRQLTTVSERLGHNTVSLLPSRVFFVVVVVININLKAWPWWNDFFFPAPVCVNQISFPDSNHFGNINDQPFCDNLVSKYLPRTLDSVSVTRNLQT